ncbi:ABC transporter permease [Actinoplanes sp. NPDC023936]|uniref:ABC transporter permease n=1 Tax=Actinoplanes sp. NPDC023936 TaxID=3154910 RepID=UPI0033E83C95
MTPPDTMPRGPALWIRDLLLGVRLSVAAGRTGWTRLTMISVGIGLGVAMLLAAAALPSIGAARSERAVAQQPGPEVAAPGPDTLLIADARTEFRDRTIAGHLVRPEGERAPVPPGVGRLPASGEMVVSPALAELLESPEGELLRDRWNARVVGTIGPAGLTGPRDHVFYLGDDQLAAGDDGYAQRVRSFGDDEREADSLAPLLVILAVVGLVVLLVPVMVFVTTAVRFGGEARDRQLAAIRLVGADTGMTRRIAAGETLTGAVLGLLLGGLVFAVGGRLVLDLVPPEFSFFASDLRPVPALVAALIVLVPAAAVLVTLSALRRVVIEPLGVVRHTAERRRRLWWRLIPTALGAALLSLLFGGEGEPDTMTQVLVAAGVTLLLIGVVLLLPWVVQATVRRLGGSQVSWQLAIRRLQLDSGTAVRAVSGIAVSVAGVIAMQGLVAAFEAEFTSGEAPGDRFQATVYTSGPADGDERPWVPLLTAVPGVTGVSGVTTLETRATPGTADEITVRVADCAALQQYAKLDACADGDSFYIGERLPEGAAPGATLSLPGETSPATRWTVPGDVRTAAPASDTYGRSVFLSTPAAFGTAVPAPDTLLVALDRADPDAIERLRNASSRADPFAAVQELSARQISGTLAQVQQGLLVGATALLLIIGASMLVNVLEQLRERRRLLAVLVAFGVRRTTLSGSVLYQVAIPVVLGLLLAMATGTGLSALLAAATDIPVRFDWAAISGVSGAAAATVLAVAVASLPLLWRLTKPEGLRSE